MSKSVCFTSCITYLYSMGNISAARLSWLGLPVWYFPVKCEMSTRSSLIPSSKLHFQFVFTELWSDPHRSLGPGSKLHCGQNINVTGCTTTELADLLEFKLAMPNELQEWRNSYRSQQSLAALIHVCEQESSFKCNLFLAAHGTISRYGIYKHTC